MRLDERLSGTSGVHFDAMARIDAVQSPCQLIEVFQTEDLGKLMRIDGANMVAERDEFFYHENLIHPAAIAHPSPRNALIVGGGDGGAAEELLKHPSMQSLQLCELDAAVVEMAKKHLRSVHRDVFADPRLTLRIGDGLQYLRDTADKFDLIYLDLTDPIGPAAALYTTHFYVDCKRALATGGALTLHIGSPFSHPQRVRDSVRDLRAMFEKVAVWFVHIPLYGATWGFACGADALDPRTIGSAEIDARLSARGVGARRYYEGKMHQAMLSLPPYIRELIA
ncbi:MAG TPA: polyamine aminopropyltransferase [Usitatibacteraceae bacterium]